MLVDGEIPIPLSSFVFELSFMINNWYSAHNDSSISSDSALTCSSERSHTHASVYPCTYTQIICVYLYAFMHAKSNGSRELVARCRPFISLPLFCSF